MLVIRQEDCVEGDPCLVPLGYEPSLVELGSTALECPDRFMDGYQQLGDSVQGACFEVDSIVLLDEKLVLAGHRGQRAPVNVNLGFNRVKRPSQKLSGLDQT